MKKEMTLQTTFFIVSAEVSYQKDWWVRGEFTKKTVNKTAKESKKSSKQNFEIYCQIPITSQKCVINYILLHNDA